MKRKMGEQENSLMKSTVAAVFVHSEVWGAVWFGFIFWGSVINAVAIMMWPDESGWLVAVAAYSLGLAIGALAKARGGWL
jgi:ATP/ADP translocase